MQWLTTVATCRASAPASENSSNAPTPVTRSPLPSPAQQPKTGTAARPVQQASGDREGEASSALTTGLLPWHPSSICISSMASAAGKVGPRGEQVPFDGSEGGSASQAVHCAHVCCLLLLGYFTPPTKNSMQAATASLCLVLAVWIGPCIASAYSPLEPRNMPANICS